MRTLVRCILGLFSLGILTIAFWPPGEKDPDQKVTDVLTDIPDAVSTPTPTPSGSEAPSQQGESGVIRDVLGGAQLDTGLKAKEKIGEINNIRERQLQELENPQTP